MLNLKNLAANKRLDYLEESGHHHCHQGWAQIHCPFCTDGTHGYHLGFNLTLGNFNCWRCGGHSVWDTVSRILRTTDRKTIYDTIQKYQKDTPKTKKKKRKPRKRIIEFPAGTEDLPRRHRRYLKSRGFNPRKTAEMWGIKGTTYLSDEWNWRVIVPIFDRDGEMIAYAGRTISDEVKPKYKMSENKDCLVDPLGILYGLHKVPGNSIIIVEGMTDVWRIGPGAVGLLGIDWNTKQANILRHYERRFILLDPEPQAQKRAEGLALWLSGWPGETEIISGHTTDPGDFSTEEVSKLKKLLKI